MFSQKKKCCLCPFSLFISLPLIFTLLPAKFFHFLTNAFKFSCCVHDEARLIYFYLWLQLFLCFISRSMLVISLLSTSAQTLKRSRKKTWLCCCFFSLKVRVAKMTTVWTFIIELNAGVASTQSKKGDDPHFKLFTLWCGRTGVQTRGYQNFSDAWITKFSYFLSFLVFELKTRQVYFIYP